MITLLEGVRVLDFTSVVSGPVCTQTLASLGADVVKIEPVAGDALRKTREPQIDTLSGLFMQVNRGKKSVALDLRDPEALAACLRLAADADVVVENFRPGVMDRLGLGYERLRAENPRLIYAAISGFGESGPWASMRAYDAMIQALGGFMYKQGEPGAPKMIQCAVADKITGRAASEAILAALFARERGKGGQKISVAMLDAYIDFMMQDMMGAHTFLEHEAKRAGINPHIAFQTSDGWIAFLFLSIGEYHAFFEACGRSDLTQDPRFATRNDLLMNFQAWQEEVSQIVRLIPTDTIVENCRKLQLPVAPVLDWDDMFTFEQVMHNEVFSKVRLPGAVGDVRLLNAPWKFDREPSSGPGLPPRLGEHTKEVLRAAGLGDMAIAGMIERNAAAASPE